VSHRFAKLLRLQYYAHGKHGGCEEPQKTVLENQEQRGMKKGGDRPKQRQ